MLEAIVTLQSEYLETRPDNIKKQLGQYFTDETVSNYMASMIKPVKAPIVRILDAGAGAGILTISAALQCLEQDNTHVHAVLYEIDKSLLPLLRDNMEGLARVFAQKGGEFKYTIKHENFVLSRPDKKGGCFHVSVINPPYFKYHSKASEYADCTLDLFKGNPNIYASFMAIVSACLLPMGQMIAIVPRSFTNGLYFKGFRKYLNASINLERIHIFKSRNKVFNKQAILQENIICHYTKEPQQPLIQITSSNSQQDIWEAESNHYEAELIIDSSNDHEIIRIPEAEGGGDILKRVAQWRSSFQDNGYFISTGPVVEHRTQQYITSAKDKENTVPLMRMHNIKEFKLKWTGKNKRDARFKLINGYDKHVTQSRTYMVLKRFTSKDEKKRLVTGVYEGSNKEDDLIALENHLNYVGRADKSMDREEAYGLTVLFNSTFMDQYFRCISGNTQVNATEVRLMKLPERETIIQMGARYLQKPSTNQHEIDSIVHTILKL